jgi:hypothetical protein
VADDDADLDEVRAARRDLDQVIAEIRAIPGYEEFLAAPTFDDVAGTAVEQPLVYLAAAEQGGLALIVRGAEVTSVPADDLTEEALRARVSAYRAAYEAFCDHDDDPEALAGWRTALEEVTGWLWTVVMGPVLDALRPAPAAVLVAGGQLGLLPLHAAWTWDEERRVRHCALDELTLTYVPNARSLAAARDLARGPADRFVGVPDLTNDLHATSDEVAAAAVSFGSRAALLGPGNGPAEVSAALREADVAHFAGHGFARLQAPLESGLELSGGRALTLRDVFALNLRMRLVVLSACETLLPGEELPDEVIALPTGLLQAGVGGILASMWLVGDVPTLILMIEFYRLWRYEGVPPPDALRQAQLWLRDTPDAEIVATYDAAAAAGAAWLPPAAYERILVDLGFREPGLHSYGGVESWAAFGYVGA